MKLVILIKKILSVILLGAIFLGSSGITVIEHDCKSCGAVTIMEESVLTIFNESANCCEEHDIAHHSKPYQSICKSSCEFKIEQYIVSNFVPSPGFQLKITVPAPLPSEIFFLPLPQTRVSTPLIVPDKYGGPSIFTLNCQLRA
jgi:hypothetical protein